MRQEQTLVKITLPFEAFTKIKTHPTCNSKRLLIFDNRYNKRKVELSKLNLIIDRNNKELTFLFKHKNRKLRLIEEDNKKTLIIRLETFLKEIKSIYIDNETIVSKAFEYNKDIIEMCKEIALNDYIKAREDDYYLSNLKVEDVQKWFTLQELEQWKWHFQKWQDKLTAQVFEIIDWKIYHNDFYINFNLMVEGSIINYMVDTGTSEDYFHFSPKINRVGLKIIDLRHFFYELTRHLEKIKELEDKKPLYYSFKRTMPKYVYEWHKHFLKNYNYKEKEEEDIFNYDDEDTEW